MCPCGRPLHYSNPRLQAAVQRLVDTLGENIRVTVGDTSYWVSRHFIALHGIQGWMMPFYGFPEADSDS